MLNLIHKAIKTTRGYSLRSILGYNCTSKAFSSQGEFDEYHPMQVSLFNEKLIVVDSSDQVIGEDTKLNLHLKSRNNPNPHRAFSLLLFDPDCNLILQRRSPQKVTFPGLWSNACCSHPLAGIEQDGHDGVKRAIVRRAKYELDINLNYQDLLYVDKFLYKADSDARFEEFESKFIKCSGLRSSGFAESQAG